MPYTTHHYDSIPPSDDSEVRCDVCGAGLELEKIIETDRVIVTYKVTGSVWHDRDISKIDKVVIDEIPSNTNCYLCGSNMFQSGGRRGSL